VNLASIETKNHTETAKNYLLKEKILKIAKWLTIILTIIPPAFYGIVLFLMSRSWEAYYYFHSVWEKEGLF
jgi:ABC-type phosphate transport system permease subunit